MKSILLALAIIAMLFLGGINIASCSGVNAPGAANAPGGGYFHYYYDETHDVSIWTWKDGYSGGIAVLPGREIHNVHEPIKLEVSK